MIRILPPLLLLACETVSTVALDEPSADPVLVEQALNAVRPGPLLVLTDRITALGAVDPAPESLGCPRIDVLEHDAEGTPVRELWTGGCATPDGTRLDGSVEIHTTDRGQWLAGSGLSISRDGELELYFDGAIETIEQDELLLIEASATWCSPEAPCSDESLTVDLTYSIYPAAGYPDAYDITVSGIATAASDAPITVEGAWSINAEACTREPTNGAFALQRGERHDLGMDGALSCDGCAVWTVQGLDAPPYCGLDL
jgi:hypothetical protein